MIRRKTHLRPGASERVQLVGTHGSADKASWPAAHGNAASTGRRHGRIPTITANATTLNLLKERRPDRVGFGPKPQMPESAVENGHSPARWANSRMVLGLTAEECADHLLNNQCLRVDAVEVAVVIIIAVVRTETVAAPKVVGDLLVSVPRAKAFRETLASEELLRLARRHAAVVLLGEPGRAAADAIADRPAVLVAVAISVVVPVAVARLCRNRPCECEGRSARDQ